MRYIVTFGIETKEPYDSEEARETVEQFRERLESTRLVRHDDGTKPVSVEVIGNAEVMD